VFVSAGCGLYAYKVVNGAGKSSLQLAYQGVGGSSPVMANNILYIQSANSIRAIDPTTGTVLWTGATQGLHWESPIVFNGVVVVPDDSGNLTAFGL
jgi:outer membrane protein assembly factor BamB